MPTLRYFVVDAFTDRPFAGNPAAVVPLPAWPDDAWLQNVAMEMNLSETAFLVNEDDGYRLRWFTPKVEVALCGHATLASAHVLWSEGYAPTAEEIRFHTKSGLLKATWKYSRIELDFPAEPPTESSPPPGLLEALGASAKYVGRNRFDYLVEVESEDEVRRLAPDFARLSDLEIRGVIVTSRSTTPQYDFVSRFFAPRAGVDEDPVTGSAHCCLGPYWQGRLGKSEFTAFQASARGGVVHVRVARVRTYLGGQAVTVLRGELVA
ncbi:MAG: PhzF family phenazine biosynthesis protein [Thermoguttaceae bacterium]